MTCKVCQKEKKVKKVEHIGYICYSCIDDLVFKLCVAEDAMLHEVVSPQIRTELLKRLKRKNFNVEKYMDRHPDYKYITVLDTVAELIYDESIPAEIRADLDKRSGLEELTFNGEDYDESSENDDEAGFKAK